MQDFHLQEFGEWLHNQVKSYPEHFCYEHFKVISFMPANSQRSSSRRDISSEAGGRVERILKRVCFQIGEPRTAQDMSRTCALSILSSAVRMGVEQVGSLSVVHGRSWPQNKRISCWFSSLLLVIFPYRVSVLLQHVKIIHPISWRNKEFHAREHSNVKFSTQVTSFVLVSEYL